MGAGRRTSSILPAPPLPRVFRDARLIPACAIGSVLPDLIDKPVGIILLADTLGYGRIYGHTLLFAALIIGAGLVVTSRYPQAGVFVFDTSFIIDFFTALVMYL